MDQPGKYGCQSCSCSAEQGNFVFLCPRPRLKIWCRETGWAVPSRVSSLILHTQSSENPHTVIGDPTHSGRRSHTQSSEIPHTVVGDPTHSRRRSHTQSSEIPHTVVGDPTHSRRRSHTQSSEIPIQSHEEFLSLLTRILPLSATAIYSQRQPPWAQSRVDRATQLRTDGVHSR